MDQDKKNDSGTQDQSSSDTTPPSIKINLALPCYGGTYKNIFVRSLLSLMNAWRSSNIYFHFNEIDCCDVEVARNYLISNFYFNKKECSHILFIDNDMGFDSNLITRMLVLNKEVVGVVAPKRQINLEQLHAHGDLPYEQAMAKALEFILAVDGPEKIKEVKDGFIEVESCGAGILLISRLCIDKMIKQCPDILEKNRYKNFAFAKGLDHFLTPFKKIARDETLMSEDISFCHRWTQQCGGKIYANIDSKIQHAGTQVVEGRFIDKISRVSEKEA